MKKYIISLLLFLNLYSSEDLILAEKYYNNKEYQKSYKLYKEYADKNKDSNIALKLGIMAENGIGIPKNNKIANKWFDKSFSWDPVRLKEEKIEKTIYQNIADLNDIDSTKTFQQLSLGFIKLKAYETNYFIFSYLNDVPSGDLRDKDLYKPYETKFKLSIRSDIDININDYIFVITGAYSQTATWQNWVDSAPFRNIDYEPELFTTFPMYGKTDFMNLKAFSLGVKHSSNGERKTKTIDGEIDREMSLSRSWNRVYLSGYWQYKDIMAKTTAWYKIPEVYAKDDNPNIIDYYGNGNIKFYYIYEKLLATTDFKYNFKTKKGSTELTVSYPIKNSSNLYFYTQFFKGYGYTLIDYNKKLTQIGFGISMSR